MIPPAPTPPARPLPPLRWWLVSRRNMLAVWPRTAYLQRLIHWPTPGQDVCVVNRPDLLRRVLVNEAEHYPKSAMLRRMLRPMVGDGIFISEGALWRERRRQLAPLFHNRRLPGFIPIVEQTVAGLLTDWADLPDGAVVDMHRAMTGVSAAIASRAFLGRCLDGRADAAFAAFRDYERRRGRLGLPELLGLPDVAPWRGRRAAARLHRLLAALPATHGDCPALTTLLGEDAGGAALRDEAAVLFLAGHETTASALCFALYLLARNPDSARRVAAEGTALPADADLGSLTTLRHTRAVVAETLRLYPPLPLFSRENPQARRLGETHLAARSLVVVSPWLLHRHHGYWREPDAFDPTRFDPDGPVTRLPTPPVGYSLLPFGAGPRGCPGSAFALLEATLVLARLLARYRFETVAGHPVEPVAQLTLMPRGGLPLRLRRR